MRSLVWALAFVVGLAGLASAGYWPVNANTVVDLSPTVSMSHYQNWPGGNLHHQPIIVPYHKIGPDGPWASDLLIVDENTATQIDCPPHMMPTQDSGLPNAGYWGFMTCDKVPAWQWVGEVFKVDARSILDQAPNGVSPIITVDMVKAAERAWRPLWPGDAVLYWSGYDDKYDLPMPAGARLLIGPIAGTSPSWPDPDFDTSDYVTSKGVKTLGTDAPSMGAFGPPKYSLPGPAGMFQNPLALESHLGNFKRGAIHTEGLMNLDKVPNGSLYIGLPVKHKDSPTVETRAAAITDLKLAAELMKAVRAKRVVDLSVILSMQHPVWWPGAGVGNYVFPYHVVNPVNYYTGPFGPYWVNTHIMDAHTGTHMDPPAHFGPPPGFDFNSYNDWTKGVLRKYEAKYGKLKTTDMTSDKVPVSYCMGPARVVNVKHLVGTTDPKTWPASPKITVEDVQAHEKIYGPIQPGEVVLFNSNHVDTFFREFRRGEPELQTAAPLNGQSEGWPAPTPETLNYIIDKGVKCVGTDGVSMGSVVGEEAVMTHWAAASRGVPFVEHLIGVGQLPPKGAFFIFLNPKIEDNHGGPGRAIAILP
ncbi:MAG: cyclase family protein [candidate division NC10 bacterium]|nr:cyclase family protein [candidate division NC10 bacterium]